MLHEAIHLLGGWTKDFHFLRGFSHARAYIEMRAEKQNEQNEQNKRE
jgi:hypothetical protein